MNIEIRKSRPSIIELLFFITLTIFISGCDSNDVDKKKAKMPDDRTEENLIWSKKDIVGEDGREYLEVKLNDEVLMIPEEYRALNPPDSPAFHTVFLWPGVMPVKTSRNAERKYDFIRMVFQPNNQSEKFKDTYFIMKQLQQKGWVSDPVEMQEHPEITRYDSDGAKVFYEYTDNDIKTPSGNPLVAACYWQKEEGDRTTYCLVGITWSEELTFQYEFRNYQLVNELPHLHQEIKKLIQSFYGE